MVEFSAVLAALRMAAHDTNQLSVTPANWVAIDIGTLRGVIASPGRTLPALITAGASRASSVAALRTAAFDLRADN